MASPAFEKFLCGASFFPPTLVRFTRDKDRRRLFQIKHKFGLCLSLRERVVCRNRLTLGVYVPTRLLVARQIHLHGQTNVIAAVQCANIIGLGRTAPARNESVKLVVGQIPAVCLSLFALELTVVHQFALVVIHGVLSFQEGIQIVLVSVHSQIGLNLVKQLCPGCLHGAVDKHPNFHAKFTSIWYNKKNGRGVKI